MEVDDSCPVDRHHKLKTLYYWTQKEAHGDATHGGQRGWRDDQDERATVKEQHERQ
jgi:hypothetical protein